MRSFGITTMTSFPSKRMENNTTPRILHICTSYLPGESNRPSYSSEWADGMFENLQITRSLLFASKRGSKLELVRHQNINLKNNIRVSRNRAFFPFSPVNCQKCVQKAHQIRFKTWYHDDLCKLGALTEPSIKDQSFYDWDNAIVREFISRVTTLFHKKIGFHPRFTWRWSAPLRTAVNL